MRDARRNEPERLKLAQQKKIDEEVYAQKLADEEDAEDDSDIDEDPPPKKRRLAPFQRRKKHPLRIAVIRNSARATP